jgi:hypothetical protein
VGDPNAPPLRVRELLELLDRHRVRCVLVGELAAVAHGSGRATFDIDVVPDWTRENLDRLASALVASGARLRVPDSEPVEFPVVGNALERFEVSTWRTNLGDIDVICGTPTNRRGVLARFDDLVSRAHRRVAFGITILVADLADIIEAKEALARGPDLAALPELHRLRETLLGTDNQESPKGAG